MNDIEPLLVALVVFAIRDGLREWWLLRRLLGPAAAVPLAHPRPTVDAQPVPAPNPVVVGGTSSPYTSAPHNVAITATSFAGSSDSVSSRTSAYDGKIIDGDREIAAALPGRVPTGTAVRVTYGGRSVEAPVRDIGPWNSSDPYWLTGARPQAETGKDRAGRKTNLAGIDLTPAAWRALGWVGDPQQAKGKVDWEFAAQQAGFNVGIGPAVAAVPPHLALMRSLIGIDAKDHAAAILGWAKAIGLKFPEMAAYADSYASTTVPWCGLTVAYVLAMNGVKPPFGATDVDKFLWADSWRTFGTAIETPAPGDILVFHWAGGGHHVTIYDHTVDDAYYHCTGGNQGTGHAVSTEAMPMKNCVAVRRIQI